MYRRDFNKGLLTTTLATPPALGPTSALSFEKQEAFETKFSRILLNLFGARVAPAALLIVLGSAIHGVSLTGKHREFDENRARVRGLLGAVTRPTIEARLETAAFLGTIHLQQNVLFVLPNALNRAWRFNIMIAHAALSWDISRRIGRMNVSGMPSLAQLRQARQIGELFLVAETLALAMIYPVLGRDNWRRS